MGNGRAVMELIMKTENTCVDCGVEMGESHGIKRCPKCRKERLAASYAVGRQRVARYEVTPPESPWIEGVDLDAIYPQDCYLRAYKYACDVNRCFEKHQLVVGATSLAFGGHAWVELPSGIIFDGVYQRFYRKDDYYGVMAEATPWYFFDADATTMLGAHLRTSPSEWWLKLGLPMIKGGRPPIKFDSKKAWASLLHYYRQCDESLLKDVPTGILRSVAEDCEVGETRRMKRPDLVLAIKEAQHTAS